MPLQKNDFIEIEFTGKVKDGEVFDSNKKEDLEKTKQEPKPFIYPLGQEMFLKGIDDFLIGKEIGEYTIPLTPDQAFGKRDPKLIQMIPMKVFIQHQINPIPGATFNFDNKIAKILTVSGGRVMVDFNNPVAGKEVEYQIKIKRKIEDKKEQTNALNEFFFKKELKFEIKDKKLIVDAPKELKAILEMLKQKYKDILGLDLEIKEPAKDKPKEETEDKKEEVKKTQEEKSPDNSTAGGRESSSTRGMAEEKEKETQEKTKK